MIFFIYVIGRPISWVFEHLTSWLGGMTGTSAILLGAILGLMIAFDMGGPVNKTAFLFGAGLIATGNQAVMGMCAAAIPVMPLGQGLATLLRGTLYTEQERETGLAALFMGCFGIPEGAIPFAAGRPAQVIPANMLGGAVAGAVVGLAGVEDAVPHGGPIVAGLGAVSGVPMFFVAVLMGTAVTAVTTLGLAGVGERKRARAAARPEQSPVGGGFAIGPEAALVGAGIAAPVAGAAVAGEVVARAVAAGTSPGAEPAGMRPAETGGSARAEAEPDGDATAEAEPDGGARAEAEAGRGVKSEAGHAGDAQSDAAPVGHVKADDAKALTASGAGSEAAAGWAAQTEAESGAGTESTGSSGDRVLSGHLTRKTLRARLRARGKDAAIREMADLLARSGKVADVDELVRTALRREEQGTTGLGEGIAIPHAKTDAVTAPVVGFARSDEGVERGSLDGTKARLVFMIAVPEAAAGDEHLRILALLSRKLMDAGFRERLLAARDEDAVLVVLREVE